MNKPKKCNYCKGKKIVQVVHNARGIKNVLFAMVKGIYLRRASRNE
jgi:hypothetical protein